MADPISNFQGAPLNGPFSQTALLADGIVAAPYEGVWIPTAFLKYLNVELETVSNTFSMQLYGTNLDSVGAVNQYTITVTGTATNGDVVTLTFANSNLSTGSVSVSYTVATGNSVTQIAAGLVAAINANAALTALGFAASNSAGVVTATFPSIPLNNNISSSTPSPQNSTMITKSVSGSATETITIAAGTNGNTIGSAITTNGFTSISPIPKYIKARFASASGTPIYVGLQGVG